MILKLIIIALGFALLNYIRKEGWGPKMPLATWTSMQREGVKRRLKRKDIPILCEAHARMLTRGDIALVDHKRCQKCTKPTTPKKSA